MTTEEFNRKHFDEKVEILAFFSDDLTSYFIDVKKGLRMSLYQYRNLFLLVKDDLKTTKLKDIEAISDQKAKALFTFAIKDN